VTAAGSGEYDFVSRFFSPEKRWEDPVTGSAHTMLIPYWSAKRVKLRCWRARFRARRRYAL
jgi:predicted PhzF superfamily epimerase YddE/YHI9